MFNLLDIAYPGRPYRPRPVIEVDSVPRPRVIIDSVHAPEKMEDTLSAPSDILDTLGCKDAVLDTLRSAANFFTDFGAGNGSSSTLLWSVLLVLVCLTLCGYFMYVYRRQLTNRQ